MAENEKLEQTKQPASDKKSEKKAKPGIFARIGKWFKEMKSELKKVVWPSGKQLVNNTVVVLVAVLIVGIIVLAVGFYIATDLAPLITSAAANVNFDMGGAAAISSICDGANPLTWVITRLGQLGDGIGLVVPAVVAIAMAVWNRMRILKEAKELHAEQA